MRVIIIDHEPYSPNKKQRYYISDFLNDNFCVEYWSVYNILPYLKGVNYPIYDDSDGVKYFISYKDFLQELKQIDNSSIVILELWFKWSTIIIFLILKFRKIKFVKIDYFYNILNLLKSNESKLHKLLVAKNPFRIIKLISTYLGDVILDLFMKGLSLNKPSILFLTGKNVGKSGLGSLKRSLSYFDVLKFEEIKNDTSVITYKYIVFLDIFLVGHPDLKRSNLETINPVLYYKKMNVFFDKIEKCTGFKVLIAAHPQSNYINSEYGQRDYFYNRTAELVNNCEFVLTHGSLSINFAVLSKKSIIYIYMDEFLTASNYLKNIYEELKSAADYFKALKINIDHFVSLNIEDMGINEMAYNVYLEDYLYSTEFPKPNYKIIKDNILSLYRKS